MKYPRLLILGGAGKTGKKLVEEALQRGYQVTAMVRNPVALAALQQDGLVAHRGDMTDTRAVNELLEQGFDAVLCTLGIFQKEPGTPLADMTRPLLDAMEQHGPRRFVLMSSLGVGDSKGQGNLVVKFVTGWILRYVLVDKNLQEKHLRESNLDWTILRPPRLLENDEHRPHQLWQGRDYVQKPRWQISNRDAAKIMLDLLEATDTQHQAYQCSY